MRNSLDSGGEISIRFEKVGEMIRSFNDPDFPFLERLEELSDKELEWVCAHARTLDGERPSGAAGEPIFITRQR